MNELTCACRYIMYNDIKIYSFTNFALINTVLICWNMINDDELYSRRKIECTVTKIKKAGFRCFYL